MTHPAGPAGRSETAAPAAAPPWGDLLRGGRAVFSVLVILGVALHALQVLVIAIIMPTVAAELGGAAYYTWPSMLYTIGAIVGAASVGPLWGALGRRRGYALSGAAFLAATVASALAPDMGTLVAARAAQGLAGGLITGGGMALIGALFTEGLRKRVLAAYQGTWMVAQLCGPLVGGAFAEIGWWRGSFWTMVPLIAAFTALAWLRVPEEAGRGADGRAGRRAFPLGRLGLLAAGTFAVALAGPAGGGAARVALIALAVALIWATFRLDRHAANRLYPSGAFSVFSPVGLALMVTFLGGMAVTSVNLFLPLLLQVVHGVTPLFVSFVTIVISFGWTLGTFAVSGWSGRKESLALMGGVLLMIAGMAGIVATATLPALAVLTLAAFVLGLGVGTHYVLIVARTMASAKPGEERVTSAAIPSIRSLGTAFGAAIGGMVATAAGLGDATGAAAVGGAVTAVFAVNLVPLLLAAACMARFLALARARA